MKKTVVRNEIDLVFDSQNFPSSSDLAEKYGLNDESQPQFTHQISSDRHLPELNDLSHKLKFAQMKIEEKNREIESLCVMLEALEPLPGINPLKLKNIVDGDTDDNVDFRDSKIVSLAKKSHKLTMLLNKERCGNEELKLQLKGLKSDIELASQKMSSSAKPSESKGYGRHAKVSDEEDSTGRVASLNKELREMSKQCEEYKRKTIVLNDENKSLTKALNRELGDGVTLDQAVDGGWRGRAQQIIMLKSKVKKLEKSLTENNSGEASSSLTNVLDVDIRAQDDIAGMSNVRRRIVDALTEERVSLTEANQTLERKAQAQKARINILEGEIRKLKENFQLVLDKSATDDELLEMLRNEVGRLKTAQLKTKNAAAVTMPSSASDSDRYAATREDVDSLQTEINRLQRLCKNQAEQIDSQDQTLRQLKKRLG